MTAGKRRERKLWATSSRLLLCLLLVGCGGAVPTPVGTPAVTLNLSANNLVYDKAVLTVPADATFAIDFTNHEVAPHNVSVRGNGAVRDGETFSGPATRHYVFAGLPAGSYTFVCAVHPEMTGVLESVAPATAP